MPGALPACMLSRLQQCKKAHVHAPKPNQAATPPTLVKTPQKRLWHGQAAIYFFSEAPLAQQGKQGKRFFAVTGPPTSHLSPRMPCGMGEPQP